MGNFTRRQYLSNTKVKESLFFAVLALILLVYSLVNHYSTKGLQWSLSPYLFPLLVSVFIIIISVSLFSEGIKDVKSKVKGTEDKVEGKVHWDKVLFTIFISIVYYIAMDLIGFIISTILFLVILFIYLGEKRKWLIALIAVSTTAIIYFMFGVLLHVMLP